MWELSLGDNIGNERKEKVIDVSQETLIQPGDRLKVKAMILVLRLDNKEK